MNRHSHLTDDQLVELCLSGAGDAGVQPCPDCEARRAELAALLTEVSDMATQAADAAFPAERLTRQQARILHRIEQDGRPARVIAFPGHAPEPVPMRNRPSTRWIAGAAAAGLVIGLFAGHFAHDFPGQQGTPLAAQQASVAEGPTLRAVAATFSEEEFLGQIELAADSPGGMSLRPLHDLTPSAWDVK